jgi:predicted alpha-1,2-mannosidase
MYSHSRIFSLVKILPLALLATLCPGDSASAKDPVDYVNPYIGNISHLLVPTYPTVQLPNSMLRFYPSRQDYTDDLLRGFTLVVPKHRRGGAFNLLPQNDANRNALPNPGYHYDLEKLTPYNYSVYLDDLGISVRFTPAHQSALYQFNFDSNGKHSLTLTTKSGSLSAQNRNVSGYEDIGKGVKLYVYLELDQAPSKIEQSGRAAVTLFFAPAQRKISARYGVSYISVEQAQKNLRREITDFDPDRLAASGRKEWNRALGKIQVDGGSENDKAIFYTALYRTYERMINISEDGHYFSAFDSKVHADHGTPFYTDDWTWDTYLAAHPLGILLNPQAEEYKLNSYLRMYEQSGAMPTFPGPLGDDHAMNSNHYVTLFQDAYAKGLRGFDLEKAYAGARKTIMETTHIPWKKAPATELDKFYQEHGFFPALRPNEPEIIQKVTGERRQAVAVTLGASFDDWCLSLMAKELGKADDSEYFSKRALNYRNLFNAKTGFFHPKDANGNFIEPFDYVWSGGRGSRDYYDENHGWIYRWSVQHNIGDLISLMGGREKFSAALDSMFDTPLDGGKVKLYSQLPDHTGNVGQFSMGNEPSFHIPYLYNYAGQPWKTQKRIRSLIDQWYRNDLMGIPGDEDGGGMSAFVVFSMMGFYPVTPGIPAYNIGSPMFEKASIELANGKKFVISAKNCSRDNKYIQSAKLNGKPLNQPWFWHKDIANGGTLELVMGDHPNKSWGSQAQAAPPSWKF